MLAKSWLVKFPSGIPLPGDEVKLTLDLRARLVPAPGDASQVAVTRGPLVLARDQRLESSDIDLPALLKPDRNGFIGATLVTEAKPKNIWMRFDVPLAGAKGAFIPMCDFASTGKTWTKVDKYRVWIPLK